MREFCEKNAKFSRKSNAKNTVHRVYCERTDRNLKKILWNQILFKTYLEEKL